MNESPRRVPLRELHIVRSRSDGFVEWRCRSQSSYPALTELAPAADPWTVELAGEWPGDDIEDRGLVGAIEWLERAPGFARVCASAFRPVPEALRERLSAFAWILRTWEGPVRSDSRSFPLRVARDSRGSNEALRVAEANGMIEFVEELDEYCDFVEFDDGDIRTIRAIVSRWGDVVIVRGGPPRIDWRSFGVKSFIFVDSTFDGDVFFLRVLDGWPLDRAAWAATPETGHPPILWIRDGVETAYLPDRLRVADPIPKGLETLSDDDRAWFSLGPAPREHASRRDRARDVLLDGLVRTMSFANKVFRGSKDQPSSYKPTIRFDAGSDARDTLERIYDPELPDDIQPQQRVTKAFFHRNGAELHESVAVDTTVGLRIRVIPRADDEGGGLSVPVPEPILRNLFVDEAVVDVRLFLLERDWSAPRRQAELTIPRLGSSEPLEFELTPRRPGRLPLRVGVYARNILLQSFSAWLFVHERERASDPVEPGYALDYVANADFQLLDELEERTPALSLFINRADETHWVGAVSDAGNPITLQLSDEQVLPFIEPTRRLLERAHRHAVETRADAERPDWLDDDLVRLACRGRQLHANVFTEFDQASRFLTVADRLSVARIDRDAPQLPWSLLYDFPILTDPDRVTLCPKARERGPLEHGARVPCVDDAECRGRLGGERHVCPYGFWGFRHRVELELGVDARTEGERTAWAMLGEDSVRANAVRYAFSSAIEHGSEHAARLREASTPLRLRVSDDGDDIRTQLRRPSDEVFYILCHGKHEDETHEFYLEFTVGDQPTRLSLAELRPLPFDEPSEPRRFIVILNACESAAVGPGTVHRLFDALRQLGAVAIVGTEVEVERSFALEFGPLLLDGLVHTQPLGELMYQLRWRSWVERMDPSGLVYSAYGPGSLRVIVEPGP